MTEILTVGKDLDVKKAFALHNVCFSDDREWFDELISAADGQEYIASVKGGEYVGGMFLFDMHCGENKGRYIYALGVLPSFRGQGIAAELLLAAKERSEDFTLICAADEKLALTYEKHGFDRYVGGTVCVGAQTGADIQGSFGIPCRYSDIPCGLLLNERLFAFSLEQCDAKLYTDGKTVVAKSESGFYAAYGGKIKVPKKAQIYLKKDIDLTGICADIILEI